MKRIVFGVVLTSLLAMPVAASAATVTLTDWKTGDFKENAPGGGGAFKATTTIGSELGTAEFLTFCLEFNEHFSLGGTYNFTLSDGAVNGGVAGGNPDPVDAATKLLYYHARTGGYLSLVEGLGGNRLKSGWYIQEAIWHLEEERTTGLNAISYLLADWARTNSGQWGALHAQGHRVFAMNLTPLSGGGLVQDQLAYYRVPDSGSLVVPLAGLMLLTIVGARVRRREEATR